MIPESKKALVDAALDKTFGTSEIQEIRELTDGLSTAVVYRIVVLGRAYVLRVIMRDDILGSLENQYANMRAAAEVGVAPEVLYTGIADKISITAFKEPKEFPVEVARKKLPALIKKLHALPPFPHQVDYLSVMDGFNKRFSTANILDPEIHAYLYDKYLEIMKVYPRNLEDRVSCHNDTKIDNIIFDGNRAWLVDWEASFLNDGYLDLALVANFVIWNHHDEIEYLAAYFGKEPTEYQLARLFIMRQLLSMSYLAFLLTGPNSPAAPDPKMSRPDFKTFHDMMWNNKISVGVPEIRQQYALVHQDQLLNNLKLKRFEESLKILAGNI